jgi:hypothetical protein
MTRKLIFSTGEHNRINAGSGSKLRFIGIIRRSFQLKPGKGRIEQTNPALTSDAKVWPATGKKPPHHISLNYREFTLQPILKHRKKHYSIVIV